MQYEQGISRLPFPNLASAHSRRYQTLVNNLFSLSLFLFLVLILKTSSTSSIWNLRDETKKIITQRVTHTLSLSTYPNVSTYRTKSSLLSRPPQRNTLHYLRAPKPPVFVLSKWIPGAAPEAQATTFVPPYYVSIQNSPPLPCLVFSPPSDCHPHSLTSSPSFQPVDFYTVNGCW